MATPPPKDQKPQDPGTLPPSGEAGQALYLSLLNEQLVGWDNPRAMLEQALRRDQFMLLGQKLLSLKPGAAYPLLYEVLLRMKQEENNLLPPGGFFPIAESLGMMGEIDRWVVRNVIAWSAARLKKNPSAPPPLMCVNISGETFDDRSFVPFLRDQLNESGLSPRNLCFELSEVDIIEYHKKAREFIAAVKPGCRITLDSFGSVKASFAHLEGLAINFIKIDGMLTQGILREPATLAKVRAINTACQKIGIRTIAEFVETREMLDKLRGVGVDYLQGFGIARPESLDKIS